jgi:carbamoyl-phosphate synthase large subunit
MNILLTSAGRRVELFECIKEASLDSIVYTADTDSIAPTLLVSNKGFTVSSITDLNYSSDILEISKKNKINGIIPLLDPELIILSNNQSMFNENKIQLIISNQNSIQIANDKVLTFDFFKKIQIKTPTTIEVTNKNISEIESKIQFPLFIKPRFGSNSKDVGICKTLEELSFFTSRIDNPIVQENIIGNEVTIDVFGDGTGNIFSLIPRLRLKIRSGEVERAITINDKLFRDDVIRICKEFKPYGPINIQCFVTDDGPVFSEINARFGGGYPLSNMAGAKFPELLTDLMNGKKLSNYLGTYTKGLIMSRYDKGVYQTISNMTDSTWISKIPSNLIKN